MKILNSIYMFGCYSKITIRAWFQYRIDALVRSFAVFLREATGVIVIYLTLQTFTDINGWNQNDMMFLFSLLFVTYGIFIIFFTGLRDFQSTIQKGNFDRLLLRPRGTLFQVLASNSDWFAAIGHGGLGIVLFLTSANNVNVVWTVENILYYVVAIISGVLIQGAIFLFFSSLSFFFIKTDSMEELFYRNGRKFAGYPISIYNKIIQFMLVFIVPFAFVNYFPAQYLLRKSDMGYSNIFLYVAPFVGLGLYLISYSFWRFSIKYYKSTGN